MLKWIPYAMVRVTAFFIAGVLGAIYLPDLIPEQISFIISFFLFLAYFLSYFFLKDRTIGLVAGILGLSAIAFFSYSHLRLCTDLGNENHLAQVNKPIKFYKAIVRSSPESKAKSWKVEVEVTEMKTNRWQEVNGKVLLYVSKLAGDITWMYGDQIIIRGSPLLLRPPANPGEFDFKRFLSFKNIYHQQFVLPNQVKCISAAERKGFIHYSHIARRWALQKLNSYVEGEKEQAIAAALILGVTEGIDTDLLNAYSASGAMHVLAVSGLHVGIIYAILLLLLKPLNRYSWSRWAVAFISLFFLWVFAFVTGLSPSVLRAVVMFSFVALARPFGKRTNIYNTLAASAFVLLLYNPYLIMSVGFQLSYLAVLGIVYLQRPIYHFWEIENRIGDWIWSITCVSIAAQIATFSLGLLYFHQFPVYFLISNLFVIPLSTGVLVLGILILSISFIGTLAMLLGKILTGLIYFLNWTVFTTEKLPFSLISDVYITTFQCWLLMGVLLSVILLFEFRSIKWIYSTALLITLFIGLQWQRFQEAVNSSQFILYSISGHHALEVIEKGQSYFVADSALLIDEDRIRFHVRPNRLMRGVSITHNMEEEAFCKVVNGMGLLSWKGKTFAKISQKNTKLPKNLKVDYLIVSNNSFSIYRNRYDSTTIGSLILDGTNSTTYCSKLRKFALAENIPIHAVLEEGAFTLTD